MEVTLLGIVWFLFILSLSLMLLFFLRSERLKDKLIKTEDALVQLAGKDNFFEKKGSLLRPDELTFYHLLQSIVGDYYLFPQIHLSELVKIKNNSRDHDNLYAVIGTKSVDYVIFRKQDMSPLLAVELNGGYHSAFKTQNKDRMKEALFQNVGIKLISVDTDNYNADDLSQKIKSLLSN